MKCSLHVHSLYSDGKGTISEIVESAKKLGIDELGISDHLDLSCDDCLYGEMPLKNLEKYVSDVLSFSNLKRPAVRLGLEVEFVPSTVEKLKMILSAFPIDYLIGSVHCLDNKYRIDFTKERLPSNFCSTGMQNYWNLIRQMAESRAFDIVGHIDLPKKFGYKPSIDLSNEIDEALHAISEANMAVELNTSGWFYPCKEQYPSLKIINKCIDLKIPFIVSADSHTPENLSRSFDRAYKLLRELGVSKQVYFIKRKPFFTSISEI